MTNVEFFFFCVAGFVFEFYVLISIIGCEIGTLRRLIWFFGKYINF